MEKDKLTILLEVNDMLYGKVELALNEKLQQVCIIDGKVIDNPDTIYEIKLRNCLCRNKEEEKYIY